MPKSGRAGWNSYTCYQILGVLSSLTHLTIPLALLPLLTESLFSLLIAMSVEMRTRS